MNVVLALQGHRSREKLASALRARGLQVYAVPDLPGVLDAAKQAKLVVALIDPRLLQESDEDIRVQLHRHAGYGPQVVALTNRFEAEAAAIFDRHGATLLEHPPEETASVADWVRALATRLSSGGRDENTGGHWIATGKDGGGKGAYLGADKQGPTILVVEDEPTFRNFLCDALGDVGYRVWAAANAEDALAFLQKNDADLVMADINMPGIDGFELKLQIDLWKKKPMPFIIMTADSNAQNAANAAAVGVVFILGKPIRNLDALYGIVRETLKKSGVTPPDG